MKTALPSICLALAAAFLQPALTACAQSGVLLKTFNLKTGKLLVDPNRPRLYALLPNDNGLAILDTNTNTVLATLGTGNKPSDLAISIDGKKLYVANSGSAATAGVTVVDLDSLTVSATLSTPFAPGLLVAGLGNHLYMTAGADVTQVDATTGASQGNIGTGAISFGPGYLKITPDGHTLIYCNQGVSPANLETWNVSGDKAVLLQVDQRSYSYPLGLVLSHNGQFFVPLPSTSNGTRMIPTSDLGGSLGAFSNFAYSYAATFSPDDRSFLNAGSYGQIDVYSTQSTVKTDSFALSYPNNSRYSVKVDSLAVTAPGAYLYVSSVDSSSLARKNLSLFSTRRPPFFDGSVALDDGFYYLKFADGVPFGYYNFNFSPYLYHNDLGFEYPFDAADGTGNIFLYDFKSQTFWFTGASYFPYLYDFTLNAWLYYYPDPTRPDYYNTNGVRYFYNFATGQIISK